ncbi:MAG: hypothetical protein EOP61_43065, partial [Sphingomonadales bacterium]
MLILPLTNKKGPPRKPGRAAKPCCRFNTPLYTTPMPIQFADLGLSPVAFDLGVIQLRWYAISYVAMIAIGWWYLLKLIARPGAPMSRKHADDLVTWIMIGVLAGGRLGYCLVYKPEIFLTPWKVLELWNGGMSLHGGLVGVLLALWW